MSSNESFLSFSQVFCNSRAEAAAPVQQASFCHSDKNASTKDNLGKRLMYVSREHDVHKGEEGEGTRAGS